MKNIKRFEDYEVNNENIFLPNEVNENPVLRDTSYDIKYPHNEYQIGEEVEVDIYADKHGGKKGIIGPPNKMKDKVDHVKIDFEDGTSDYVPITHIKRV